MSFEFTNKEVKEIEKIGDDLIVELFYSNEKYYTIRKYLKKTFMFALETRGVVKIK